MTSLPDRFPELFSECFDYSPPPGWIDPITQAVEKLEELRLTELPELRCVQWKEKLGGLRGYLSPYDERAEAIVEQAANECATMCEVCGEPGSEDELSKYWIRIRCDKHKGLSWRDIPESEYADG